MSDIDRIAIHDWIEEVTKDTCTGFCTHLKDGVLLCRVMNELKPGSIDEISDETSTKEKKKNFSKFFKSIKDYGVENTFDYRDVVESNCMSNSRKIYTTIDELIKLAKGKGFVPKKKKREYSKVEEEEEPEEDGEIRWANMGSGVGLFENKVKKIHKKKGMGFNRVKHNVIKNGDEESDLYTTKFKD